MAHNIFVEKQNTILETQPTLKAMLSEQETIYVEGVPYMNKDFEKLLFSLGYKSCAGVFGVMQDLISITADYWAISTTKKAFVYTSKTYGNPSITMEEFKHKFRGEIAGNKFGI